MSDDNNDWYDKQKNSEETALPGDGESWSDYDEPEPLHNLDNEQWGTANPPRPAAPGPGPGPGPNPHMGGHNPAGVDGSTHPGPLDNNPRPNVNPHPGPGPGYGPGQGPQPNYPMQRAPQTGLSSTSQIETNDIIAVGLNFFVPGAGYLVLGQTTKGLVVLLGTIFTCGAGYILTWLFVIDAYMVAMAQKNRKVDDWEFFPK